MKKIWYIFSTAALHFFSVLGLKVPFQVSAATPRTLKILAIGNSFSEDATYYLYQIAKSAGIDEVVIGNLYIGGCSLATHWNNAKTGSKAYDYQKNTNGTWVHNKNTAMEVGIKDENWDVITLQQVSGLSGVASTYNSDLTNLIDFINSKKTNKSAKLVWHMTWAYQSDSTHTDFSRYNKNQLTMYNAIVNAVQEKIVTNSSFNLIIPQERQYKMYGRVLWETT